MLTILYCGRNRSRKNPRSSRG